MRGVLQKAIVAKIAATPAITSLATGGAWQGRAPDEHSGIKPPYIVFFEVAGVAVHTMSDTLDEDLIQFSIWDTGRTPEVANQIADAVRDTFDNVVLVLDSGTCVSCMRQGKTGPINDPDGGWQITIDYLIRTEPS